jgi:hypothetical protein
MRLPTSHFLDQRVERPTRAAAARVRAALMNSAVPNPTIFSPWPLRFHLASRHWPAGRPAGAPNASPPVVGEPARYLLVMAARRVFVNRWPDRGTRLATTIRPAARGFTAPVPIFVRWSPPGRNARKALPPGICRGTRRIAKRLSLIAMRRLDAGRPPQRRRWPG